MKFMKFALAFVAILAILPSISSAGVISNLRAGVVNELEDDDFEVHIDNNNNGIVDLTDGNGLVDIGELLVSMFVIQRLDAPIGVPTEVFFDDTVRAFTGVSVLKVLSAVAGPTALGPGATANFTLGAATTADFTSLGLTRVDAGTVAIVYDDPAEVPHINPNVDATTTVNTDLDTATNGTPLWEFGFRGDVGEFFFANTSIILGPATDSPFKISNIDTLSFFANLNVTHSYAAVGSLSLIKHDELGFGVAAELQLAGNRAASQSGKGDFQLRTDTDFYILPTPEPTAMVVWLGLASVVGAAAYRRRKLAA